VRVCGACGGGGVSNDGIISSKRQILSGLKSFAIPPICTHKFLALGNGIKSNYLPFKWGLQLFRGLEHVN